MATNQSDAESGQQGVVDRLFLEHPRSLGMTWSGHGARRSSSIRGTAENGWPAFPEGLTNRPSWK